MKILVIYREGEVVNHIKAVLQSRDPFVRYSESGLDGLLAARVEKFDLVICGTDLPVITGFEVIRSMRSVSMNEKTAVVFITHLVDNRSTKLAKSLEAEGIIMESEISAKLPAMAPPEPLIDFEAIKKAFTSFKSKFKKDE